MHGNSKTSTFSSEVQVHFPVSHCAHKSDCVKAVPFCRDRDSSFSHSPKAKKRGITAGLHLWTLNRELGACHRK